MCACARARAQARASFRYRLHCTNRSPGGATSTLFPRAPLPARAAPLRCRFVPGTRLHARPLHLQGTLPATSGLGVPSFQVSVTAISPPQGPLGFPGPGARLTGSPWFRGRALGEPALLRRVLLRWAGLPPPVRPAHLVPWKPGARAYIPSPGVASQWQPRTRAGPISMVTHPESTAGDWVVNLSSSQGRTLTRASPSTSSISSRHPFRSAEPGVPAGRKLCGEKARSQERERLSLPTPATPRPRICNPIPGGVCSTP